MPSCFSLIRASRFIMLIGLMGISALSQITRASEQKSLLEGEDTATVHKLIACGLDSCPVNTTHALLFLQDAVSLSIKLKYQRGIGLGFLGQGRVYYYKDEYGLALKYLKHAQKILLECHDEEGLAQCHFFLGEIYRINSDYINALNQYKEAITLSRSTGNLKITAYAFNGMGMVMLKREEPQKALDYFVKALDKKRGILDTAGMATFLTNKGLAYEKLHKPDSALACLKEARRIREEAHAIRGIASSDYHLGDMLIRTGEYSLAEKVLEKSLQEYRQLDDIAGTCLVMYSLARAKSHLNRKGAAMMANEALKMASGIHNAALESQGYQVLSEIFYRNQMYKQAFDYLLVHQEISDSLFTREKERFVTEFEEQFQSEMKDQEITYLKERSRINRQINILMIVILVSLAGILILLFFLFRFKSRALNRQRRLAEQEQVIHRQQTELFEQEKHLFQEQLESKNRELASKALEMLRINETISTILDKLDHFPKDGNSGETIRQIREIVNDLENKSKQHIWEEFDTIFKHIHTEFYTRLLELCPDLSITEIKTAALLKLNLTTKEIAAITFKSEGSIKTTRYRLRKKLNLESDDKLVPFLLQI